jgi:PAS domain S-box-containing protein
MRPGSATSLQTMISVPQPPEPLPPELPWRLIDAAPFGVVLTDEGLDEPSPRILYANAAFSLVTGYPLDAVLGRSPRFLQGERSSRVVLDRLREALRTRQPFQGETWNYRADGEPFLMRWNVRPLWSAAGKLYFFATQEDVTELRRLEAVAESSNLAENVGTIFSGIRHELGNPVNSIKVALTLLRRRADRVSPERLAESLDRILEEVKRIEYLLSDLRSFNAVEEPQAEVRAIGPLIDRFVTLAQGGCEARGCRLVTEALASAPLEAKFDERALYQVLLNLVTNALDAFQSASPGGTPGPGSPENRIVIRLSGRQELAPPLGTETRRSLVVEVEDNGPGMSAETQRRAFTPFFTTKVTGSGLGLALSRRLLAQMGATLELRSAPGKGSVFRIELAPVVLPALPRED